MLSCENGLASSPKYERIMNLCPFVLAARRDLLEVIEDRQKRKATIITAQLDIKHWHELIGEPTVADAILDRLVSSAHKIKLSGKSLR